MTKIILHCSPQPTRSARARWALEEAGVSYEPHLVDVFKGEQNQPAYLKVNPLGVVPTLMVDGEPMIESAAIALWAAEHNPAANLGAALGTAERRQLLQWVVFAPAEIDRLLATLNTHTLFRPPETRDAEVVKQTLDTLHPRARKMSDALENRPYLLGDRFSIADVCIGHAVVWMKMLDRVKDYPTLVNYLERLQQRTAFRRVYGPEVNVFPDPHTR